MFASLEGRSVVVTGASKGIGKGIARRFAQAGCKVLLTARRLEDAAAAADALVADGLTAVPAALDVTDGEACRAAAALAADRFGGIDILCANAGIYPAAPLDAMTGEDFDRVLGTNLKGTFLAVQACLPALKESGQGRIVLTSSITGPITGYPGWSHYGASKAGQLGFMRTAAIELAPFGITVNAVMPGNIVTEGLEGNGPDYLAAMAASIPLKRLGTVEDIANAALYFASAEAAYVTGQALVIDGGQVLPESLAALDAMVPQ